MGNQEIMLKTIADFFKSLRNFLSVSVNILRIKKKECDKINVLCLIPTVVVGGAEKVVLDIVNGLKKDRYCFHLLAQKGETNPWCQNFLSSFYNAVLFPHESINEKLYKRVLSKLIERLDIRILLVSNSKIAYRLFPWVKSIFPNVRIIDLVHAKHPAYLSRDFLSAFSYLDRRVCISEDSKDYLTEETIRANLSSEMLDNILVIYNGNDMKKFRKNDSCKSRFRKEHQIDDAVRIISFIGRFSKEKCPLIFVEIAQYVISHYFSKEILFLMAGDGEDLIPVKRRIKELNLNKYFLLTGMISEDQIQQLLEDTYVLLIPSEREGLSLVMVEAMSMEVPVISTNVGAVREAIIDGVNGFIILLDNCLIENFSKILIDLLKSPKKRDFVAKNCRYSVEEKFSLENMTRKYSQLFASLNIKN